MGKMVYVLIPLLCIPLSNAMADNIKEGKWQITTIVTSKSEQQTSPDNLTQSYAQGPNVKDKNVSEKCVTNANPIPDINQFAQKYPGCIAPQVDRNGGIVDYSIACNSDTQQISLVGHVVFKGNTMKGYASVNMQINGQQESIQTQLTGKYLGNC